MKDVWSGGEALTPELRARFFERIRPRLYNGYGPTETSVGVLYETCAAESDSKICLGRPIANTQCYLTDADLNLVPAGVAGELLIGGVALARGYVGRAELTADRFVPNPFYPAESERLYKTGDLGRYGPDGRVEFLGRLDRQVKVRGFRIELGEIEAALTRHPGIASAVAAVNDQQIFAYCIARPGDSVDSTVLRDFLRGTLPAYMAPTSILLVPDFPLTANGKIDTRSLLSLEPAAQPNPAAAAPGNETERLIAEVWKSVLGRSSLNVNENFFDAGGHSLSMVQVQSRLNEALSRKVTLIELFTYPTIRQLAAYLDRGAQTNPHLIGQVREQGAKRKAALMKQREQMRRIRN